MCHVCYVAFSVSVIEDILSRCMVVSLSVSSFGVFVGLCFVISFDVYLLFICLFIYLFIFV